MRDEETRRVIPHDLYALQFVGDPQPSPDGSRIAFVVTMADEEENDYRSRIWLVATDGESEPMPLTAGTKKERRPAGRRTARGSSSSPIARTRRRISGCSICAAARRGN